MAYTDIDDPTIYFNTKLYTGNGSTNAITGVGFAPDWTLLKDRNDTSGTRAYDTVRGAIKRIRTDLTDAEIDDSDGLTAFGNDGFTLGADGATNANSTLYVSWNWLAGGSASSNSDGDITSSVSANTTAGFSIVSWTGSAANATVGHGLGVTPKVIMVKNRIDATNWNVFHSKVGNTGSLYLNSNQATETYQPFWNNTSPTSSVFTVGSDGATNGSSDGMIAYCFAEKKGYSKFGIYEGASSADGSYIHLGFKPAWFLAKAIGRSENWYLFDNKRLGYNVDNNQIYIDTTGTEATTDYLDFLSNGVKYRYNSIGLNGSGEQYIYMAFAESPFVNSKGVPNNAR